MIKTLHGLWCLIASLLFLTVAFLFIWAVGAVVFDNFDVFAVIILGLVLYFMIAK
ncbi:hypothetical protein GWO43_16125 [candidate division KSB1 bacterium]|nr:hypothetical protein [candidate division KSB1 bacterium]NIV68761.1 hypothetical protein [Phycisphaerae bacterium]NIS25478.1 hypothetical protein [candidate division KSB1 bacterium]NIT72371.1 hypothetical protein [candidate division KSB1 bacterium]NIU26155.1 hypothetical protein [candidate division KSB1 bacterium]